MADIGAYVFLLAVFGVLFGLPTWLMVRHHKKSKAKIEKLRESEPKLTAEEQRQQHREGYKNAVRTVGIGLGAFVGVRLMGLIGGILLSALLGFMVSVIADLIWSDKEA